MTQVIVPVTTYNQASTLQVRSVRDLIDIIEPKNAVLLKLFGLNNEKRFRLRDFPRIKYEWFDDTLPGLSTTINDAGGLDTTETAVTVTDGTLFAAGHVVKVNNAELMLVVSVSGNDLTVVRDISREYAAGVDDDIGTTAADGSVIEIVGVARVENSDYVIHPTTSASNYYNYTQIFDAAIAVSRSEAKDTKYGITDTMAFNMSKYLSDGKRAGILPILLQKTFYHGKRFAGTATEPRLMGGFDQFVSSHLYSKASTQALDFPMIEQAMQDCWDDGGRPDILIGNSWAKRKFSEWFKGTIRTERSDRVGGAVIDTAVTDFGEVSFVHDWLCPTNAVYLVDPTQMGWIEFDPFQIIDEPVTVDGMVKRILGEYGFVLTNEKAAAKIYGWSTSI